ncbi:hypothetical protein F2Q69_00012795 [Brassica cretica]|uniref:DUF4283 domain-containing protein n=1 Tax=Brassica cretica TaxID=69181 RepID=A0A8S9R5A9_BRACR|nr:hypothetical protein F2Q69_00012795 [Brassica cretica]
MFYVVQWSAKVASQPPSFSSIPLWAYFKGIPFDLYTQEGLSRVGDLLGYPLEVDVAHIKCRVDCTKPLPKCGESERDNGEVVTVTIDYPWAPPICPSCKENGHLESHCPSIKWKPSHFKPPPPPPANKTSQVPHPTVACAGQSAQKSALKVFSLF